VRGPICAGFAPPDTSDGALPMLAVRLKTGANCARLALYPIVFTFVMLLPTMSSKRECATTPERPVNRVVVEAIEI